MIRTTQSNKHLSNSYHPPPKNLHRPQNIIEGCFLSAVKLNKFTALYDMLHNPFYSTMVKTELEDMFFIMQKNNMAINQFIYKWRYARYHRVKNTSDLLLNSLSSYNPVQIISLVENNTIYDFCLIDLLKIIHNALLYHENLFSKPSLPKNPYTNLPFGIHNLYNIYFHIVASSQIMPLFFQLFFLSNFNVVDFFISNETYLRDESIKSYYNDRPTEEQYHDILSMLHDNAKYIPNIIIHSKYPKQRIINAFKNISVDYLMCQYSYSPTKKTLSHKNIKQFLIRFNKNSPTFGRVVYNNTTSNPYTSII